MNSVQSLLCGLLCVAIPLSALGDSAKMSRGVTAGGQVVVGRYKKSPPWAADIIKHVVPQLPPSERSKAPSGEGFYRALLNVSTGTVRDVVVLTSSGSRSIDSSVVRALRQWRLRPGKWKEFEIHIAMHSK